MKLRGKIICLLLCVPLLLMSLFILSNAPPDVKADSSTYTQKVVAVVYDDSGSMGGDKSMYAEYALKGLCSIFDDTDYLKIFPLNKSSIEMLPTTGGVDRNQLIKNKLTKSTIGPSGGTSSKNVLKAETWLTEQGLNSYEKVDGKDFWLIILSDGLFDEYSNTSALVKEVTEDYVGLQTIYCGICIPSQNCNIGSIADNNSAITDYYPTSATDIIDKMQEITNKVTGRYTFTSGVTTNGKDVTIDLGDCGFSVTSVTILAQGATSELKIDDYKCTPQDIKVERPCTLTSGSMSGYTAVLSPQASGGYFDGDYIELSFNEAPSSVTVLLEPAIEMQSRLQHFDGSTWKDITEEEVNNTLTKGAKVRTRYKLIDKMNNKDLSGILTNVTAQVTYNGQVTDYNNGFSLETGKKEIALSVKVDINGSEYNLQNSFICHIEEQPSHFRIESAMTEGVGGDSDKIKVDYKVYFNDSPISKSFFTGSSPTLKWELIGVTNPMGEEISSAVATLNNDGTISVTFNRIGGQYGNYVSKLKVMVNEDKRARTSSVDYKFFPTSLALSSNGSQDLTLTSNEIKKNTKSIEFILTSDGAPVPFGSNVLKYTLKIDGADVTEFATAKGNVLSFIPSTVTLSDYLQELGDKDVELKVWSTNDTQVSAQTSCKLSLIDPTYRIEVFEQSTDAEIYDLKSSNAKIYYKVNLDGVYLTKEEIQQGLDNKTIKVNYKSFGWALLLPADITTSVVDYKGDGAICVELGTNWIEPFDYFLSSVISDGEKEIEVTYGDASESGAFNLLPVSLGSRLLRLFLFYVFLYVVIRLICWAIGFGVAKEIPKGALFTAMVDDEEARVSGVGVNLKLGPKLKWHLVYRLVPFTTFSFVKNKNVLTFILWMLKNLLPWSFTFMSQPSVRVGKVIFEYDERDKCTMTFKYNVEVLDIDDRRPACAQINKAIVFWQRNKKAKMPREVVSADDFLRIIRKSAKSEDRMFIVSSTWYGQYTEDDDGKILNNVRFFCKKK